MSTDIFLEMIKAALVLDAQDFRNSQVSPRISDGIKLIRLAHEISPMNFVTMPLEIIETRANEFYNWVMYQESCPTKSPKWIIWKDK